MLKPKTLLLSQEHFKQIVYAEVATEVSKFNIISSTSIITVGK